MMPPDRLRTLQQVNKSLRAAITRLCPERTQCAAIRPEDFSILLAELLRASECFQAGLAEAQTDEFDASVKEETRQYGSNLETLYRLLPALQIRLMLERARLEQARSHLLATENWARLTANTTSR